MNRENHLEKKGINLEIEFGKRGGDVEIVAVTANFFYATLFVTRQYSLTSDTSSEKRVRCDRDGMRLFQKLQKKRNGQKSQVTHAKVRINHDEND